MPGFGPVVELSSLNGANGFQISGEAFRDNSGTSVASAGDVNGDGFDDLIVGAQSADPNGYTSGASYVVFGQAGDFATNIELSELDGTNGFQISGEAGGDYSGHSVASAGDVNGDGFDDLIVGARGADPNGYNSGASYVVFGQAGGFAANIELSGLDGTNGFQINGEANPFGDFSGTSVASAGDVNGDGFDDLIVGATGAKSNGYFSGASYVVFGQAGAFTAEIELSDLDGTNGFQINGEAESDFSGFSVDSAGDVNGDGFDDLIIGAPYILRSQHISETGASYVVFGQAAGFAAEIDLSDLDGTNGFQINGENGGDSSGSSVASAGDVNGDGLDDLIIGAPAAQSDGYYTLPRGASYVVFGQPGGFAANVELSDLDGTNGFQINGEALGFYSGTSVASAGDVNGDGFDDLIVGAPAADINGGYTGASYVVFGQPAGFAAEIALSDLDGANGFQINGEPGGGHSGHSVASAGDVNGDGFDDLLVGAPFANANGEGSGASYVIFGQPGPLTRIGTESADSLVGGDFADTLEGRGGNDTLDGRGGADTMLGGAGDDAYVVDNAGDVVTENGGEGADTVLASVSYKLGASVNNLTLTGTADIDGTGTGSNNTLTGNSGDNRLDGGGGADGMAGGVGDDTYVVDSAGDVLTENPAEGNDTVQASITFDLAGRFNNLTLTGTANIDGTGTVSDNVLRGNTGRNTLDGEGGEDVLRGNGGNDTLIGGADADVFAFGDDDGDDVVADFEDGIDKIDLTAVDDVNSFGELHMTDTGGGVLIDYGNGTIQLDNVASATSITASDFIIG